MIISPKIRGFICLTAHPLGCMANVNKQIAYVKKQKPIINCPNNVLVIGASTGYGLASRIVASFGANARTIGVFLEKSSGDKRTSSPGWYNTVAFEEAAEKAGIYAKSINGDAFSLEIKQQVIDTIKQDWGGRVDLIIHSLAAPKRKDPLTQQVYSSVLKPIGKAYQSKNLNMLTKEVSNIIVEPATDEEILHTIKVMGGEDWELWIKALKDANVLAKEAITVNYSYVGPEITFPIYRNGTIGKAKEHLESTANSLNQLMQAHCNGRALISVNKGLVTQASSAIPVVPLYFSLLYKVMKKHNVHEGCIEQIYRLFATKLYQDATKEIPVDNVERIRIDDWELREDIQKEIKYLWERVTTENLEQLSDIDGYRQEFYNLFGFEFDDINYNDDVEVQLQIPSIQLEEA